MASFNEGLRVLSLDGGGIRGLSILHILKSIMDDVNNIRSNNGLEQIKPHQLFDLICGTSTGGLIAIMLGRLGMDVDQCITAYQNLCSKVFGDPSSFLSRSAAAIAGGIKPKFDSTNLREQILSIIRHELDVEDPASVAFEDPAGKNACRVFVCATSTSDMTRAQRLRSYKSRDRARVDCTILQAALATSAATGFFEPQFIDEEQFVDGAISANNPAFEAFEELKYIYGLTNDNAEHEISCFISIGTGKSGLYELSDNAWKVVQDVVKNIVTETQSTADQFESRHTVLFGTDRAFRFNVDYGLDNVGLDEWNKLNVVRTKTRAYLKSAERSRQFDECSKKLAVHVGPFKAWLYRLRRYLRKAWWSLFLLLIVAALLVVLYKTHQNMTTFKEQYGVPDNQDSYVDQSLPMYAILGVSGVGKSSFIDKIGGRHIITGERPAIGTGLQSETRNIAIYKFHHFKHGDGYVIDTPGIDDSNSTLSNREIMQQIQNELRNLKVKTKLLDGMIFLFDINSRRVHGSVQRALDQVIDMIDNLCGRNGVAQLTLVTTGWPANPLNEEQESRHRREKELRDKYWVGPMKCNAGMERYEGHKDQAVGILINLKNRERVYTKESCHIDLPESESENQDSKGDSKNDVSGTGHTPIATESKSKTSKLMGWSWSVLKLALMFLGALAFLGLLIGSSK